jgi:hypothetical protein
VRVHFTETHCVVSQDANEIAFPQSALLCNTRRLNRSRNVQFAHAEMGNLDDAENRNLASSQVAL